MAPQGTCITNQLRQLIYYHLDNNFLKNALFLAERLVACDSKSSESAYLLALCHFRLGDYRSAYEFSKPHGSRGIHLGCAYVYAQSSLALERYKDGIVALEKSRGHWGGRNSFGKHSQSTRNPFPDAAAVNCLLGKLCFGYDDKKKAVSYFEEALKLNPFMWDAFTSLCDMGAQVRVGNIFKPSPEMEALMRTCTHQSEIPTSMAAKDASLMAMQADTTQSRSSTRSAPGAGDIVDPFHNVAPRGLSNSIFSSIGLSQKINESNPANSSTSTLAGSGPDTVETPVGPTFDDRVLPNARQVGTISTYTIEPPQAPARRSRTLQGIMGFSIDAPPKMNRAVSTKRSMKTDPSLESVGDVTMIRPSGMSTIAGDRKRTVSGQVVQSRSTQADDSGSQPRRSERLFHQVRAPSSSKTSAMSMSMGTTQGRELKKARPPISRIIRPGSSTSTVGRVVSGNRKPVEDYMDIDQKDTRTHSTHPSTSSTIPQKLSQIEAARQEEDALRWNLDLFRKLGHGYFSLAQYQCQEAITIYGTLPSAQQNTPWVQAQFGRAYYEQAAYAEAEQYYRKVRTMAPTRFEDMEVYSTILWHLKRETDLSFLAHELVDSDWKSPQAWCALGNAWSLARDHEQALRCFKRATQLDPKFAYAFTLQGHEHVANEEYDKALLAYRHGMAADKRHYNAYYGVGRVFEKLGQFDKASHHYSAASTINPTNAVLICCIGTVIEKQKNPRLALQYFTKATELAPRSALTRFKKARALMAIGELNMALQELMTLKDLAPDEAMVHFLLGRLYKRSGDKSMAVRHFTIALNLDPKASPQIKEEIESLDIDDDEDDCSMMN